MTTLRSQVNQKIKRLKHGLTKKNFFNEMNIVIYSFKNEMNMAI